MSDNTLPVYSSSCFISGNKMVIYIQPKLKCWILYITWYYSLLFESKDMLCIKNYNKYALMLVYGQCASYLTFITAISAKLFLTRQVLFYSSS